AKEADAFINAQIDKMTKARDDWEAKNPIKEADAAKAKEQKEQRAKVRARLVDVMRLTLTLTAITGFTQGKAFDLAEEWLTKRATPLLDKLPEEVRKASQIAFSRDSGTLKMEQARKLKEGSPERQKLTDAAIADYDAVLKEIPGDLVAGNNLAWLLVKE